MENNNPIYINIQLQPNVVGDLSEKLFNQKEKKSIWILEGESSILQMCNGGIECLKRSVDKNCVIFMKKFDKRIVRWEQKSKYIVIV